MKALRNLLIIAAVVTTTAAPSAVAAPACRAPVVLFTGYHGTKLKFTVHNQTTAPECPSSGSFEDWYQNDQPTVYSQVCQDKLRTLRYNPNPFVPMPLRFSEQPGVSVDFIDYGKTSSAPYYEGFFKGLEAAGYVRDKDIKVAGYDARLTPDQGGFLTRTKHLVEDTYRANGNRPVQLVGHSNGPLYAQYLLTHTSPSWRAKYIKGFTPLAGNFPGQGLLYMVLFTGLNIEDFGYPTTKDNAVSSAAMHLTAPSTYMSASDPRVFGDKEAVIHDKSTGKDYTPRDYPALLADAHLPTYARQIADYYIGFVKFAGPKWFPGVDVNAEKGSGIPTIVGVRLPDLTTGQIVDTTQFLYRDGDINQEDITNDAVLAWQAMPCHRFSLHDSPGLDHFAMPLDQGVISRLLAAIDTPRSNCPR
ncbi:lipase/acyltransferase domain-containing protein [Kibdelosporangium aridum]|uniref:lipase/acyltransferase domain-containing protein n=1 Tax=Kibdelosporangium aridum TaxID=2030 RepID=UPI0035F0728C